MTAAECEESVEYVAGWAFADGLSDMQVSGVQDLCVGAEAGGTSKSWKSSAVSLCQKREEFAVSGRWSMFKAGNHTAGGRSQHPKYDFPHV